MSTVNSPNDQDLIFVLRCINEIESSLDEHQATTEYKTSKVFTQKLCELNALKEICGELEDCDPDLRSKISQNIDRLIMQVHQSRTILEIRETAETLTNVATAEDKEAQIDGMIKMSQEIQQIQTDAMNPSVDVHADAALKLIATALSVSVIQKEIVDLCAFPKSLSTEVPRLREEIATLLQSNCTEGDRKTLTEMQILLDQTLSNHEKSKQKVLEQFQMSVVPFRVSLMCRGVEVKDFEGFSERGLEGAPSTASNPEEYNQKFRTLIAQNEPMIRFNGKGPDAPNLSHQMEIDSSRNNIFIIDNEVIDFAGHSGHILDRLLEVLTQKGVPAERQMAIVQNMHQGAFGIPSQIILNRFMNNDCFISSAQNNQQPIVYRFDTTNNNLTCLCAYDIIDQETKNVHATLLSHALIDYRSGDAGEAFLQYRLISDFVDLPTY